MLQIVWNRKSTIDFVLPNAPNGSKGYHSICLKKFLSLGPAQRKLLKELESSVEMELDPEKYRELIVDMVCDHQPSSPEDVAKDNQQCEERCFYCKGERRLR